MPLRFFCIRNVSLDLVEPPSENAQCPYRPLIPTSNLGLNPRLGSFRSFERPCITAMVVEAGRTVQDHRSGNDRTFATKSPQIVVGALDDMPSRSPVSSVDPRSRPDGDLCNRLGSRTR